MRPVTLSRRSSLLLLLALAAACQSVTESKPGRLDHGLGTNHFPVTTTSEAAQASFDEGLVWCYAFHHAEALRCFGEAAAADPRCAMAYWGMAYAAGPHINNMEMSDENAQSAHENAQKALGLVGAVRPVERALIEAIAARYAWPAPEDRKALDVAYAEAMRSVYRAHGALPDVAALFAESLMDLRPWDLWAKEGEPQPGTDEIVQVLERLLAEHPEHPQANHLYIHTVEASRSPERALAAADRLRNLVPGAGHLVHMPSHVYIRTGRYADAAAANERAIAVDREIVARTGRKGFYELYRAHNFHFLAYAAMFQGRRAVAVRAARELTQELPADVVRAMPAFLDAFMAVPMHVLVRFGRFEEILREPKPEAHLPFSIAMWHYARGVALANLDRPEEAVREQAAFTEAAAAVPEDFMSGNNKCRVVLEIGRALLLGEIAFRAGRHEEAFAALREAVRRDDDLRYDEPWAWMMPARHALGALLVEAGRLDEAEEVYRADLARHPNNGWSLRGLLACLEARGANAAVQKAAKEFERSWANADVEIAASCFCARE
jgi:tetratricopeptide (TPR) repeat protein